MRYPILPAGAFVAAFLLLVPAFWQWRTRNIPTLSLIVWLFILDVIYGANSLVWADDALDKAPVWCDVSSKLIIGAWTALPACTLCICRYLAMVGGNRTVGLDHSGRRRIALFDFGFCWGIPILFMALHFIVQNHRYNIVQYIGCRPTTHASIPGIFIVWAPPLLLSAGTFLYAGIALFHFLQMRVVFTSVLQVSDSPMSTNQYIRLIAVSTTLTLLGTVSASLAIWGCTLTGLQTWGGWKNVHSNWNSADAYVWSLMSAKSRVLTMLFWWGIPASSVMLFICLGFGEDALWEYLKIGKAIANIIPSRALPREDEDLEKGSVLSTSSKDLPPRYSSSSCAALLTTKCVTERNPRLKEFILPFPALTKTKTPLKPRAASTVSAPDSLNSIKPLRPPLRSRVTDSAFYFPATSNSVSNRSDLTRFSMSDEHLAFGQVNGPPTPSSINTSVATKTFQELPPIQSLQHLHSMEIPQPKSQPTPPAKQKERRWSARSETLRPPPLQLDSGEGQLRVCASKMRTVVVAEPREARMRGSVQVTIHR